MFSKRNARPPKVRKEPPKGTGLAGDVRDVTDEPSAPPEPTAPQTVIERLEALAHRATEQALSPSCPPSIAPQLIGQAVKANMLAEKLRNDQAKAAADPAGQDPAGPRPFTSPGVDWLEWDGETGNYLPLPLYGHEELPDILPEPSLLFGPPWAPLAHAPAEIRDRALRHMVARRAVWLRERAEEMLALHGDPREVQQVEADLAFVRSGGDPAAIRARWLAAWGSPDDDPDT